MLEIEKILCKIRAQLRYNEDPYGVIFEVQDIRCLGSSVSLCAFKLKISNSNDWNTNIDRSLDIHGLQKTIMEDDNLALVMRYCILRNKYLEDVMRKSFPELIGD